MSQNRYTVFTLVIDGKDVGEYDSYEKAEEAATELADDLTQDIEINQRYEYGRAYLYFNE